MRRTLSLAAAAAALAALPAGAQDIELLSELSGVRLPAGYYERIRRDPGFFDPPPSWPTRPAQARTGPGDAPTALRVVEGSPRMVVMMGVFADSPEPTVSPGTLHERLFGANPAGSLTQFYRELSGGRLNLQGTVLPWVRTRHTRAEVSGTSFGMGDDASTGWFLRDIVARVDPTTNFGQYDNDGPDGVPNSGDDDGYVDLAVFQFSEPAASCGVPTIWPHRGGLGGWLGAPYSTDDLSHSGYPILISGYQIQSAVNCDGTPQNISTIAHETGHAFGLPDFYDAAGGLLPHQRRWVVGCFALMAAGSWGCGDGSTFATAPSPAHMSPYEKLTLGWINPVTAEPGWRRTYTLDPVQTGGQALLVPLRPGNEFLMLEYRPNTGFDAALPAGGILVYHVDTNRPLRITCNQCNRVYHMSLVEADGDGALKKTAAEGGNRGVAGDVFTGRRVLDDHTTPSIRQNSGLPSNVRIEMEVTGGKAHFVVSMLPVVASPRLLSPLIGSAGGAPTSDEAAALDLFGNRNGRYDMGDLRAYMRARPRTVAQGQG
jgi:M6 family metalloprotease-like protein